MVDEVLQLPQLGQPAQNETIFITSSFTEENDCHGWASCTVSKIKRINWALVAGSPGYYVGRCVCDDDEEVP